MATITTATKTDALFRAYAQSAPLEDLRFYLRIAQRRLATVEYPESTVAVLRDMVRLERELVGVVGTPALKKRVWTLIDRFKTSIPEWYGHAGVVGAWVDPIDGPEFYFATRRDAVRAIVTVRTENGTEEADVTAEGPVDAETIVTAHHEASKRSSELAGRAVAPRRVSLTQDEVTALIAPTESDHAPVVAAPKVTRVRKIVAAVPALVCPTCAAALLPVASVAHTFGCATCNETWHLAPVRKVTARRVREPRATVDSGRTEKTCTACGEPKPIAEFCPGPHERNNCASCRQAYRRELASRQRAA
jgi:hypothetical protein